ncbi:MAG: hypothetical protein K2O58_08000 [Bacteroidales bacterium]|nr:hypothetical protein [Bacteroidales bacterium]
MQAIPVECQFGIRKGLSLVYCEKFGKVPGGGIFARISINLKSIFDMRKIVVLAVSAIMLVSCASFTQVTAPSSLTAYPGSPGDARGKVVRSVKAQTSNTYVLGIGGGSSDVLEQLRLKSNLKANQALSYVHVVTTTEIYLCGIVMKRIFKASALVVEFPDGSQEDDSSDGALDEDSSRTSSGTSAEGINERAKAEVSPDGLERYELFDLFMFRNVLEEKYNEAEIKEKAEMFYQEILKDIDNDQYDAADRKYKVFKRWYNTSPLYDIEIKEWIKDIGRRLSLK